MNYVVLDGIGGDLWEKAVAEILETLPGVASYVKNDRLGSRSVHDAGPGAMSTFPTSSSA